MESRNTLAQKTLGAVTWVHENIGIPSGSELNILNALLQQYPAFDADLAAPRDFEENTPEEIVTQVTQQVRKSTALKYICAGLKSVSGDAYEISKAVIPILITLSQTGVINLPPDPVILALGAIIIARMGTAALCTD